MNVLLVNAAQPLKGIINTRQVQKMVLGSGTPPTDFSELTDLVQPVCSETIDRTDGNAEVVNFSATFSKELEFEVTEIGLKLEDGTLFAYSAFVPRLVKKCGFSLQIFVTLPRGTFAR